METRNPLSDELKFISGHASIRFCASHVEILKQLRNFYLIKINIDFEKFVPKKKVEKEWKIVDFAEIAMFDKHGVETSSKMNFRTLAHLREGTRGKIFTVKILKNLGLCTVFICGIHFCGNFRWNHQRVEPGWAVRFKILLIYRHLHWENYVRSNFQRNFALNWWIILSCTCSW